MITVVIIVFAMLAGFIVTSLRGWENPPPAVTSSPAPLPPASAPTPTPIPIPTPTALPPPAPTSEEGIWSHVQAARLFDQIAHQVETLRSLSPRAEIPLSFLDEREMTALLRRFYSGRDLETPLLPYTEIELLPDVSISIRPHQTVGIYVPEQEQLYVATGQQESSADDQALLAHVYVHAMQDQHFDREAMDARATTTDAALAVRALVEGDAMLSTALYRYGDLTTTDWERLTELVLQAEQPSYGEELDRIAAWARLQRFPYWEGRRFAYVLFQTGGWETVNSAYINPPRSTEQVLHPTRYLEERDEPARVTVPDLGAILGDDWTMLLQDTLGEFTTRLYLGTLLPDETARQAADGWDGDTLVVWRREDGERTIVWRTIWDNTAEATEFERALVARIPRRYLPAWPVEPPLGLTGRWWETGEEAVYISRVARYVTFVHAPDLDALTDIAEALP